MPQARTQISPQQFDNPALLQTIACAHPSCFPLPAVFEFEYVAARERSGKRAPTLGYGPEDSAKLPMHFISRRKVKVLRGTRQSEINSQPIGEC